MTTPTSAELLPCPFCSFNYSHCTRIEDEKYFIECLDCGASGPVAMNKAKALAAWQARAALAQPVPAADVQENTCSECDGKGQIEYHEGQGECWKCEWSGILSASQPVPAADVPEGMTPRELLRRLRNGEEWRVAVAPNAGNPGPWHDWSGGECPVAGEVWVDVKVRNDCGIFKRQAKDFYWQHNPDFGDIIAWRYAAVTPVPDPDDAVVLGGPYSNVDDLMAALKAPSEPVAHTDHPLRYWDHTCPACNTDLFATPQPEQTAEPAQKRYVVECCNADCAWCGPLSETCYCGQVGPLCPVCQEVTEHAAFPNVAQQSNAPALSDEQIIEIIVDHKLAPYIQPALIDCIRAVLAAQGGKP